jgi:hypothetical protein
MRTKIITIYSILALTLGSCNTDGHRASSMTIEKSKINGTFISNIGFHANSPELREFLNSNIEDAFLEHGYFHSPPTITSDSGSTVNLVLTLKTDIEELERLNYRIQTDSIGNFTPQSSKHLMLLLNIRELCDSLNFVVSIDHQEIGILTLNVNTPNKR